ncbi:MULTISPECIES: hypothetical protein [unclassified Streptococcus]|jgi:hypothetical protein|uniref:hypothetical protein n=1 Tax=unclassified Streptococcus TaxID=2608887 RepID=UPI0020C8C4FA|nr:MULTISPECIES: hypothetical protein [unclassified Streptococcus]MCP9035953.1 hypothetical protein [Streptococcus sp. CF8_Ac1-9]MCP9043028.1 hypothetical protein [Streptococcus sp. CF8_Ac1-11]
MKKSIFRANFYESRRLRHDGFIDYMVKDTNSRKIYTKPFSIARKLFSFMGILFMFGFSALMESQTHHPDPDAPVETWGINFYPLWLFFLCWFLWFLVCRKNLRRKYDAKIPYTSILNLNLYLIWMVLALNLFFITVIGRYLTILGWVFFYVLTGIILFMIVQFRMKSLKIRLYGVQDPSVTARQQKIIEVIAGLGGIIVAGWMVLKFLFPKIGEVKGDFLGTISFIGMVFFANIIVLSMEVVMMLPYSLYGYYRNKYSEEYREFEGKSLEEWYGKKYLKKHQEYLKHE